MDNFPYALPACRLGYPAHHSLRRGFPYDAFCAFPSPQAEEITHLQVKSSWAGDGPKTMGALTHEVDADWSYVISACRLHGVGGEENSIHPPASPIYRHMCCPLLRTCCRCPHPRCGGSVVPFSSSIYRVVPWKTCHPLLQLVRAEVTKWLAATLVVIFQWLMVVLVLFSLVRRGTMSTRTGRFSHPNRNR